ncbi:MAG: Eco47II family restriction endonuclease [Alphaproteobacteria bacterium]|nr:Eco47II family restriction endonuclease [Alphaproteobacteria bacterium]
MKKLKWISEKDLYELCQEIVDVLEVKSKDIEKDLHSNIVDPFSALFDASFHKMSLEEWLATEKSRQIQKSLQNAIGNFHQKILGRVIGWKDLKTGGVADLVNKDKKIIAEIKNKFNTTKGNHKVAIYDDLKSLTKSKYEGYVAYYVAILTKKRFDKEFTPSDNRKAGKRRPKNKNIREIDGATFYEIATGDKNAIYDLYNVLPHIISDIVKNDKKKIIKDPLFKELFDRAFQ